MEHVVKRNSRSWGFGMTTTPTGYGTQIADPGEDRSGLHINRVGMTDLDRRIVSGGAYYRTRVFYKHQPVVAVWGSYQHETRHTCLTCKGTMDAPCYDCHNTGHQLEWRSGWITNGILAELVEQFDRGDDVRIKTYESGRR